MTSLLAQLSQVLSKEEPGIVLLTVAYHSHDSLIGLSADLQKQTHQPYKWLIVHNSPKTAGSLNFLAKCPVSIVDGQEGDGFSKGCNFGLNLLEEWGWEGWVWLLNPDTSFSDSQTIEKLKSKLILSPPQALLGTLVVSPDGDLEDSAGWIDKGLNFRSRRLTQALLESNEMDFLPVDWISGCSLLIKPSAHKDPPRFEPALPLYYEDMDLCIRLAKKGVPILWLPAIKIGHQKGHGSKVTSPRRLHLSTSSYLRFLQRHRPGLVLIIRTLRLIGSFCLRLIYSPRHAAAILRGLLDAFFVPLK